LFSDDSSEENNSENCIVLGHNFEHKKAENYLTKLFSFQQIPGPNDISQTLNEGPTQPKLKKYPNTVYGVGRTKRMKSFNSNWYELKCSFKIMVRIQ